MAGVEFKPSLSGVIHMERVVRRLNAADQGSVLDTAEKIKRDTIAHLYSIWQKRSGAAGRSVEIRGAGSSSSSAFRATKYAGVKGIEGRSVTSAGKIRGGKVGSGGFSVQVGSFYDAEGAGFQRGINHFVLLEGGFRLRNGEFKVGGHSLGRATQLHAGDLPASWQRIWGSDVRESLVRVGDE